MAKLFSIALFVAAFTSTSVFAAQVNEATENKRADVEVAVPCDVVIQEVQ